MITKPVPEATELSRPYWEAAQRQELLLQRCQSCRAAIFYPRQWCPECLGLDLAWERASGRGKVFSYSVVYQAPLESYRDDTPYVLALIELEEGPRMMTNVVNVAPGNVHLGMPVRVCFEERADGFRVPQFEPAEGS